MWRKFSLQSLADFAKSIFKDILKHEIEDWLTPMVDSLLGIPQEPTRGGPSGPSSQVGGLGGWAGGNGGGANTGSFGGPRFMGGYVPAPVSVGGTHVTVNHYVSGDIAGFVEAHSETIVRHAVSKSARIGR